MERLYKGIKKFQQLHFKRHEEFFSKLARGQSPDTLFITCSDSRVNPYLITHSRPGELFIVKNVGNIVPPCGSGIDKSTAAALEFSIEMLKVTDIVVCGHSDCGAMRALYYDDEDLSSMPNLRDWLETAAPVKEVVTRQKHNTSCNAFLEMTGKKHIIHQLENLKTFPVVRKAVDEGNITLHGWHYDIGSGVIYAYNSATGVYDRIDYNAASSAGNSR